MFLLQFPLHKDCCNSIAIHPYKNILATGSGQYHFNDPELILDRELDCDLSTIVKDEKMKSNGDALKNNYEFTVNKFSSFTENSLVFWWTGDMPQ